MSINERAKYLRKERLNLTMEEFGKRLGVQKSAISKIETGKVSISDQMFLAICREFNVNPDWLRDGIGEPFKEVTRNKRIEGFVEDILTNEPEGRKARLVDALASLDEEGWDKLYEIALRFVAEQNEKNERDQLHEELDRQLDEEKGAEGESSASIAG